MVKILTFAPHKKNLLPYKNLWGCPCGSLVSKAGVLTPLPHRNTPGVCFCNHCSSNQHIKCKQLNHVIYFIDCSSYRDKTGKDLSAFESLRPLFPVLLEFALFLLWTHNSSYNILSKHPRLVYVASGTLFSNIAVSFINFMSTFTSYNHFLMLSLSTSSAFKSLPLPANHCRVWKSRRIYVTHHR